MLCDINKSLHLCTLKLGLVIAGFGSGALVFTPAVNYLAASLCVLPSKVSSASAAVGQLVQCTAGDLARLPYPDLTPGHGKIVRKAKKLKGAEVNLYTSSSISVN